MPYIRVRNTSPNIRNNPTQPTIRVRQGGTVVPPQTTTFAGLGYPVGIALSITRIGTNSATGSAVISDIKPTLRIQNGGF